MLFIFLHVMGSASASAPSPPLCSRRRVITGRRGAEWPDWWADSGLLTQVFVWPKDMCSHWQTGARRQASLGTDSCGVVPSAQDAALTFHDLLSTSSHRTSYMSRGFYCLHTIVYTRICSRLPRTPLGHPRIQITGELPFVRYSLSTAASLKSEQS